MWRTRPARLLGALSLLVLAGGAAGCAARWVQPERPSERPSGIEVRELALQGGFLQVTLKIPQEPAGRKPAVIGPISNEQLLLDRGIVVVRFSHDWSVVAGLREPGAPDPADRPTEGTAETRVGLWMLAAPRPGIVGRGYFAVMGVSVEQSIPQILDELETLPEVDPDRIAIAGSSTRGFVALEALASEPRLAAAVVRVACGDYHGFLRSSSLALADDPRWLEDGELVLDADYDASLRQREPVGRATDFPPRPVLMLNGRDDPVIPHTCARRTAEAFSKAYAAAGVPQRYRFVLYEGKGHALGPDAHREALAWWDRWLLDVTAPPQAEARP